MLLRKPASSQRSAKFQAFAEEVRNRHNSRWNFQTDGHWDDGHYIVPNKGEGIFGQCTHILGSGVRLSSLYWQKYQMTLDTDWLRDRAYPMIKGLAEFYRNFPNFTKDADGLYHIHHVNNGESKWDISDSIYEVNCLHTIFPIAIRASEILGVDPDLRAKWQEIYAHLVTLPPHDYKGGGLAGFVYGNSPGIVPLGIDQDLKKPFLGFQKLGSFIDDKGIGGAQIFRNRMRLREGPGAIDAENLGALVGNVHLALVKNTAAAEKDPVIKLFSCVAARLGRVVHASCSGRVSYHRGTGQRSRVPRRHPFPSGSGLHSRQSMGYRECSPRTKRQAGRIALRRGPDVPDRERRIART